MFDYIKGGRFLDLLNDSLLSDFVLRSQLEIVYQDLLYFYSHDAYVVTCTYIYVG